MEKGNLIIKKNNQGKFFAEIQRQDGKIVPASYYKPADDKLNGKEIELFYDNGQTIKIICDGNTIFDKSSQQSNSNQRPQQMQNKSSNNNPNRSHQNQQHGGRGQQNQGYQQRQSYSNQNSMNKARAPYNFVPLNETIVPIDEPLDDRSKFHENRKTGYIDFTITSKTPIYIRDSFTEKELKEKKERESKDERYTNSDFFSPTGNAAIPGSSLRGMIRTMVEILSYSKFGFYENKRLYYRGVADSSSFGTDYRNQMNNIKSGFLFKAGYNNYVIKPSVKIKDNQWYKVDDKELIREFQFKEIYFSPVTCEIHNHKRWNSKTKAKDIPNPLKYPKVEKYSLNRAEGLTKGILIGSGGIQGKHMHWIINFPEENRQIKVPDSVIEDYKNDSTREEKANLLKMNELDKIGVPCFYLSKQNGEQEEITAIGHTGMFRLPYEKTVGEHITHGKENKNAHNDFATSIFGFVDSENQKNKTQIAGRVFFTDSVAEKEDIILNEIAPKILSSPKPTTFQHYLEQYSGDSDREREHYNSETKIRGNKLYWSFNPKENWKADKDKQDEIKKEIHSKKSQYTLIKPANPKSIFKGKIYFENLTEKELGALLCALDLQPDSYHKIGMGKSYGLGSIKIQSEVFISKPENRYGSLDSEWSEEWKPLADSEKFPYKESFSNYLLSKLSSQEKGTAKTLWDLSRIKELVKMLQFQNENLNPKFTYMEIQKFNSQTGKKENEFRGRPILPKPSQIT